MAAAKVIVLYGDGIASTSHNIDSEKTYLERELCSSLDKITANGYCGELVVCLSNDQVQDKSEAIWLRKLSLLFGFDGDSKTICSKKAPVSIGFFTNSTEALLFGEKMSFELVKEISLDTPATAVAKEIYLAPFELCFLHCRKENENPTGIQRIIQFMDSIASSLSEMNLLKTVFTILVGSDDTDESGIVQKQNLKQSYFRPKQSYEFLHAKPIDYTHVSSQELIRRDSATRFTEREIQEKGAYGPMLAQRLMNELAFRLGRAPKYGA